ncbi:hypothetical protein CW304_06450 [Bacillus sp. UFRGS-B20]|nr:hypothetical protein CW304_06450 [Bacillus sp. UFRGS-B20]
MNFCVSFVCYYLVASYVKEGVRKKASLPVGPLFYMLVVFLLFFQCYNTRNYLFMRMYCDCISYFTCSVRINTYDVIGRAKNGREEMAVWNMSFVRGSWLNARKESVHFKCFYVDVLYYSSLKKFTFLIM